MLRDISAVMLSMSGDWLKYHTYETSKDILSIGDVRKFTVNDIDRIESFYAIVVSVSAELIFVRRLYREDLKASRYLIRDVEPTGLEYAMFADITILKLPLQAVGKKVGRLSRREMRLIFG